MRLEGIVADVIQAPKLEPRIMRYELSDYEWNQVRFCRVDEQTLTYTSTPAKSPFDGREVVHEVIYERE